MLYMYLCLCNSTPPNKTTQLSYNFKIKFYKISSFYGDLLNGDVIEVCCGEPGERINLPDPIEIEFTDDCGASASITELRTGTVPGDTYLTCAMQTPEAFEGGETCSGFATHSLRLFGFPDAPNGTGFFSNIGPGEVVYQDSATWTVSLSVVNNDRADAGFDVSITYGEVIIFN